MIVSPAVKAVSPISSFSLSHAVTEFVVFLTWLLVGLVGLVAVVVVL